MVENRRGNKKRNVVERNRARRRARIRRRKISCAVLVLLISFVIIKVYKLQAGSKREKNIVVNNYKDQVKSDVNKSEDSGKNQDEIIISEKKPDKLEVGEQDNKKDNSNAEENEEVKNNEEVVSSEEVDEEEIEEDDSNDEVENQEEVVSNAEEIKERLRKWNFINEDSRKIAYLTFDDGPSSKSTPEILDILSENDIEATFFVLGSKIEGNENGQALLKRIVDEGHSVGNHGYCHDYSILYPKGVVDKEAFISDMKRSGEIIENVIGYEPNIIRFPGGHGSWKPNGIDELLEAENYVYIDWNTLNGDAEAKQRSPKELKSRFKGTVEDLSGNDDDLIVLMHDSNEKQTTVDALQDEIDYLKQLGYEFDKIS